MIPRGNWQMKPQLISRTPEERRCRRLQAIPKQQNLPNVIHLPASRKYPARCCLTAAANLALPEQLARSGHSLKVSRLIFRKDSM